MPVSKPDYRTTSPFAEWTDGAHQYATQRLAPLLDLVIRIWLAIGFFRLGVLKSIDPEPTVWLFTFVQPVPGMAPESAAALLTGIELVAPVLLLAGLATRFSAVALLASAYLLHAAYPAVPDHLYSVLLLGMIVIRGPGPVSLDHKFLPSLLSSALPLTGLARWTGMLLTSYLGPVYQAFLRIWLAGIVGLMGYAAFAGMDASAFAAAKRYGFTLMDPSTGLLALAGSMVFAAGLLAIGAAARLCAIYLALILLALLIGAEDSGHFNFMILALLFLATAGSGPHFDRSYYQGDSSPRLSRTRSWCGLAG